MIQELASSLMTNLREELKNVQLPPGISVDSFSQEVGQEMFQRISSRVMTEGVGAVQGILMGNPGELLGELTEVISTRVSLAQDVAEDLARQVLPALQRSLQSVVGNLLQSGALTELLSGVDMGALLGDSKGGADLQGFMNQAMSMLRKA